MNKKFILSGMLVCLLAFGLVFVSCASDSGGGDKVTVKVVNSSDIDITKIVFVTGDVGAGGTPVTYEKTDTIAATNGTKSYSIPMGYGEGFTKITVYKGAAGDEEVGNRTSEGPYYGGEVITLTISNIGPNYQVQYEVER